MEAARCLNFIGLSAFAGKIRPTIQREVVLEEGDLVFFCAQTAPSVPVDPHAHRLEMPVI